MNVILELALRELLPPAIAAVKAKYAEVNPDLPPLTDGEAIDILREALDSTEAKDDLWLSIHGGTGAN
jgi:hypothetical protein